MPVTTRWNHRHLVTPDGDLSVAQYDYANCLHIFMMRDGFSRERKQMWECMGCGRKFTEGGQDRGFAIFSKLAPMYAKQYSISRAMRETGHSFYVVRKYFRKMQAIFPKNAGDPGWPAEVSGGRLEHAETCGATPAKRALKATESA